MVDALAAEIPAIELFARRAAMPGSETTAALMIDAIHAEIAAIHHFFGRASRARSKSSIALMIDTVRAVIAAIDRFARGASRAGTKSAIALVIHAVYAKPATVFDLLIGASRAGAKSSIALPIHALASEISTSGSAVRGPFGQSLDVRINGIQRHYVVTRMHASVPTANRNEIFANLEMEMRTGGAPRARCARSASRKANKGPLGDFCAWRHDDIAHVPIYRNDAAPEPPAAGMVDDDIAAITTGIIE